MGLRISPLGKDSLLAWVFGWLVVAVFWTSLELDGATLVSSILRNSAALASQSPTALQLQPASTIGTKAIEEINEIARTQSHILSGILPEPLLFVLIVVTNCHLYRVDCPSSASLN
ncbi:MAG: hypothetical protein A4E44_02357 [Methanosaeta sp. PtaB.Bin018]|nr:MAG: hypothetical protein A4E44_02357 [Methanosaeta sp. PtaB.Bin018]OPY47124.1 MAG: hypothetical protein A4E46_00618 [Methanosaeta sp. PtaU1.Bin016]